MASSHATGLFLRCRIEKANLFTLMSEIVSLLPPPQPSQPSAEDFPRVPPCCLGRAQGPPYPRRGPAKAVAAGAWGGRHRPKGLTGTTKCLGYSGTEGKDFTEEEFQGGGTKRQGVSSCKGQPALGRLSPLQCQRKSPPCWPGSWRAVSLRNPKHKAP